MHLLPGHLESGNWEGKGLLSTLPAIANTLIGVLVGQYLRSSRPALEKIAQLFLIGNVMMFLGLVWSIWFPINQNLWTSSLVVFSYHPLSKMPAPWPGTGTNFMMMK
jgi:predicted acyltransferase